MSNLAPRILRVDPDRPDAACIEETVHALARGELVVIPTETVYGLAADPRVPGALDRIFAAKGRAAEKAVTLLADSVETVRSRGALLPPAAQALAARYWPGPLTLVLDEGSGAMGYRIPDHAVALGVLRRAGSPLAVTSANRSGEPAAVTADEAIRALGGAVSVVLDAGPARGGVASSVLRVSAAGVEILREGAIDRRELATMLNGVQPGLMPG